MSFSYLFRFSLCYFDTSTDCLCFRAGFVLIDLSLRTLFSPNPMLLMVSFFFRSGSVWISADTISSGRLDDELSLETVYNRWGFTVNTSSLTLEETLVNMKSISSRSRGSWLKSSSRLRQNYLLMLGSTNSWRLRIYSQRHFTVQSTAIISYQQNYSKYSRDYSIFYDYTCSPEEHAAAHPRGRTVHSRPRSHHWSSRIEVRHPVGIHHVHPGHHHHLGRDLDWLLTLNWDLLLLLQLLLLLVLGLLMVRLLLLLGWLLLGLLWLVMLIMVLLRIVVVRLVSAIRFLLRLLLLLLLMMLLLLCILVMLVLNLSWRFLLFLSLRLFKGQIGFPLSIPCPWLIHIKYRLQSVIEFSFGHLPITITINLFERMLHIFHGDTVLEVHGCEQVFEELVEFLFLQSVVTIGVVLREHVVYVLLELLVGNIHIIIEWVVQKLLQLYPFFFLNLQ